MIRETEPDANMSSDILESQTDAEEVTMPEATQSMPPPVTTSTLPSVVTAVVTTETEDTVTELDEVTLDILGADPSVSKSCGNNIQKDLAIRYTHIVTSGLDKELRKELLEKYLPPGNCALVDAPVLNPEIKAAVTDIVIKRDKAIFDKQKQTASAISSVSEAITVMLSKDDKDPVLLKTLMDTGRLLCDTQYKDSITRRNFILAVLKKELKNQIQQTKVDRFLFGEELPETLKAAKAINKSGSELKSTPQPKPVTKKLKPAPTKNWKGPPPSRRPPQASTSGTLRTREPAAIKSQQSNLSRPSQQRHFSSRR